MLEGAQLLFHLEDALFVNAHVHFQEVVFDLDEADFVLQGQALSVPLLHVLLAGDVVAFHQSGRGTASSSFQLFGQFLLFSGQLLLLLQELLPLPLALQQLELQFGHSVYDLLALHLKRFGLVVFAVGVVLVLVVVGPVHLAVKGRSYGSFAVLAHRWLLQYSGDAFFPAFGVGPVEPGVDGGGVGVDYPHNLSPLHDR